MPDTTGRATLCLSMIVKNEAHIVHEAIEAVAPYIDYWVVVDTGSEDGTQDVIRALMAERGIPGELHERPWRNFGHNRSESLALARGHADYIWLMDADDTIVGTIDFHNLTADGYMMRCVRGTTDWRLHLFRDTMPWRYIGVVHELAVCDEPHTEERLEGDYYIDSRTLGARGQDPKKFHRDVEALLDAVQRDPDDVRSVYYLAQSYECLGDYANARMWYTRYTQVGDRDEMLYFSLAKVAVAMERLNEPWPEVEKAYMRAWAYRPTRAEALDSIAAHYIGAGQYDIGYIFASRAAATPLPEKDTFFVHRAVYQWMAADKQAVCASWLCWRSEALRIWNELLAGDHLPDTERPRILANRDLMVTQLLEICAIYREEFPERPAGSEDAEVTVSVPAGPDRELTEMTLNSFLRNCTDLDRDVRFVILDQGLAAADRAVLAERYPFVEFLPGAGDPAAVRAQLRSRYWLNLGEGWRFFAEEPLLGRLIGVLEAEPDVAQVGVNLGDATRVGDDSPARTGVRVTADGGRYVLTGVASRGPAMVDLTRPEGTSHATLDQVYCAHD